jgi:hypothetical protein
MASPLSSGHLVPDDAACHSRCDRAPFRREQSPAAAIIIGQFHKYDVARRLDRLADMELQHEHHSAAERLSREAEMLREVPA